LKAKGKRSEGEKGLSKRDVLPTVGIPVLGVKEKNKKYTGRRSWLSRQQERRLETTGTCRGELSPTGDAQRRENLYLQKYSSGLVVSEEERKRKNVGKSEYLSSGHFKRKSRSRRGNVSEGGPLGGKPALTSLKRGTRGGEEYRGKGGRH